MRIPATPTRTGVLVYTNPDGSLRREYRPPAEVFHPDSLASLEGAAITIDHPTDMVTPETWKALSVGVSSRGAEQGAWVGCSVDVLDASTMARVSPGGDLSELSCGYTCDLEMTPGVTPEGETYDAVQTNIRYNHIALLPVGWARAGRDARLRLDSACANLSQPDGTPTDGEMQMTELEKAQARALAAEEALKNEKARADRAEGEAITLKAQLENARKDSAPEAIAAAVKARVALENDARAVKGSAFKCDGLSDRDLLVAIAGDLAPKEASLDLLRGICLPLVAQAKKVDAATKQAHEVAASVPTTEEIKADASGNVDARAEYEKHNASLAYGGMKKAG